MTIVELMVGVAIGLFVISMALGLAVGQSRDDRYLLQDSRLTIGLQTAIDRVTHELRRAGHRSDAGASIARANPNSAAMDTPAVANPNAVVSWIEADKTLLFAYSPSEVDVGLAETEESVRFRLDAGVIDMKLGAGQWQAVTDASMLIVTSFSITPMITEVMLSSFCEAPCPSTDINCPRQQIRRYDISMSARAATNATLVRELKSSVRVRNDVVSGVCPS